MWTKRGFGTIKNGRVAQLRGSPECQGRGDVPQLRRSEDRGAIDGNGPATMAASFRRPTRATPILSATTSAAATSFAKALWGLVEGRIQNLILHPGPWPLPISTGNPTVSQARAGTWPDGYLAHGHQDAKGGWSFPEEINASTRGDPGRGEAPRVTRKNVCADAASLGSRTVGRHDEKYLRPLQSELAARHCLWRALGAQRKCHRPSWSNVPPGVLRCRQPQIRGKGGDLRRIRGLGRWTGDTRLPSRSSSVMRSSTANKPDVHW